MQCFCYYFAIDVIKDPFLCCIGYFDVIFCGHRFGYQSQSINIILKDMIAVNLFFNISLIFSLYMYNEWILAERFYSF